MMKNDEFQKLAEPGDMIFIHSRHSDSSCSIASAIFTGYIECGVRNGGCGNCKGKIKYINTEILNRHDFGGYLGNCLRQGSNIRVTLVKKPVLPDELFEL